MGAIGQSLKASHARAQRMKECGYEPHGMVHAMGKMAESHAKFEKAIEALRDSTKVYHEKKTVQRTASKKLADAMSEGRDAVEKLDDSFGISL